MLIWHMDLLHHYMQLYRILYIRLHQVHNLHRLSKLSDQNNSKSQDRSIHNSKNRQFLNSMNSLRNHYNFHDRDHNTIRFHQVKKEQKFHRLQFQSKNTLLYPLIRRLIRKETDQNSPQIYHQNQKDHPVKCSHHHRDRKYHPILCNQAATSYKIRTDVLFYLLYRNVFLGSNLHINSKCHYKSRLRDLRLLCNISLLRLIILMRP